LAGSLGVLRRRGVSLVVAFVISYELTFIAPEEVIWHVVRWSSHVVS